jgi:transposase-like protein
MATAFAQGEAGKRLIREINRPQNAEAASPQWRAVADHIRPKVPKLATLMDAAEHDVLAHMPFPKEHRAKPHPTNPIERLSGEIKRRTEVVGARAFLRTRGRNAIDPDRRRHRPPRRCLTSRTHDAWAVPRARYRTLETLAPMGEGAGITLPAVAS